MLKFHSKMILLMSLLFIAFSCIAPQTASALEVSKNGFDEIEKAGIVLDDGIFDFSKAEITNTLDGVEGPITFTSNENVHQAFVYTKTLDSEKISPSGKLTLKWKDIGVDESGDRIDIEVTITNVTFEHHYVELSKMDKISFLQQVTNCNYLSFGNNITNKDNERVLGHDKHIDGKQHGNESGTRAELHVKFTKTGTSTLASGKYLFGVKDLDQRTGEDELPGDYLEGFELKQGFDVIHMLPDATPKVEGNRISATAYDAENTYKSGFATAVPAEFIFVDFVPTNCNNQILENFGSTIKATAHEGGAISSPGDTTVGWKMDKTYTFEPDETHVVKNVKVDGEDKGPLESYTFSGVKENHTVEVEFEPAVTVTFVDIDGTVIDKQKIPVGGDGTAPADPSQPGKKFIGWDKLFTGVEEDLIVTAKYEDLPAKITYTIRMGDEDGGKLSFPSYETTVGSEVTADGVTKVELTDGWVLDGYYIDDKKYTSDELASLKLEKDVAVEVRMFPDKIGNSMKDNQADAGNGVDTPDGIDDRQQVIVTFVDEDGTVLNKQVVNIGDGAKRPVDPSQTGKVFEGWDKSFDKVMEDLTVMAKYKAPVPNVQPQQQANQNAASQVLSSTGDNFLPGMLSVIFVTLLGVGITRKFR